jgi:hypothetical protein
MMRLLPSHHPKPYPWRESIVQPIKILGMNLPWSAIALCTLAPSFSKIWDDQQRRSLLAFHCWVWPNLIFWSIIPEHAFRHSFPLFPGISGLAGMVCIAAIWKGLPDRRWSRIISFWNLRIGPARSLICIIALWILFKLALVHAVIPRRDAYRQTKIKGEAIASMVPTGNDLYLSDLKDEGLMFYYGRQVRRCPEWDRLPSSALPAYCILDKVEWNNWKWSGGTTLLAQLRDAQDAPIFLIRLDPESPSRP